MKSLESIVWKKPISEELFAAMRDDREHPMYETLFTAEHFKTRTLFGPKSFNYINSVDYEMKGEVPQHYAVVKYWSSNE